MSKKNLAILPVLFGFFIMGFCDVVGISATHAKDDFGLTDTVSNLIPVALFSMFLLFSVPTGMLMNRIGRKKTVLISNVITMVALLIPLLAYSIKGTDNSLAFIILLVAFALLGISNTMLQVSLNPLLSNVVQGDKLASSLTAGQFVKAISSFSAPFVALLGASLFGHWEYIFPIFAVVTVLSTLWLMATPIAEEQEKGVPSTFGQVFGLLKDRTILLLFLGILFVVGVDVGVNTAAPKILKELAGLDSDHAGLGTSVYFAFRTFGAFMGAILLLKFSSSKYFRINIGVAIVALLALAGLFFSTEGFIYANLEYAIYAIYAVIGFTIATIFSIIFSFAIQHKPDKANEISGLMITGVFGGAIAPFFMGIASDGLGSQIGSVIVIGICMAYLLVAAFAIKKA